MAMLQPRAPANLLSPESRKLRLFVLVWFDTVRLKKQYYTIVTINKYNYEMMQWLNLYSLRWFLNHIILHHLALVYIGTDYICKIQKHVNIVWLIWELTNLNVKALRYLMPNTSILFSLQWSTKTFLLYNIPVCFMSMLSLYHCFISHAIVHPHSRHVQDSL